jgi:signal transduction histidine kinase
MLNTLSGRLATMLAAMFAVVAALLVGVSQRMPDLHAVIELGSMLLAAVIAFALLAALLVFNLLTRRLHLLAEALDAFRDSRFTRAPPLDWARDDGDEIDRLALAFADLSARISSQLAEIERHDAQRRELLANVSHDLRTPLTLMQGYLETLLLRHGEMGATEARGCIEVATRHAERLGRLVADLFELSKLEGPRAAIDGERFSLGELAQDVVQKFELHAQARHVGVRALLRGDADVAVRGDIGLIERALENLVENALRHTPGGGEVCIEVAGDAGRARVNVRDSGSGIPSEHLPHVFERYFQAPRVGERPGRAHAGLGLAITKRIVALHGGEIRVASAIGVGSVFSLELPLADPQEEIHPCPSASSFGCPA